MVINIDYRNIKASLDITSKITIIDDLSGTGKTTLVEAIYESRQLNRINMTAYIDIAEVPVIPGDVNLVVIDESAIVFLRRERALVNLLKSDCYFILITRSPLKELNYSHKNIYTLRYYDDKYSLERKYANYNYIPDTPGFIEDSKSGYEYFKQFFPEIRTTYGKDNIVNHASLGSTVIADGASIGPVFPLLLSRYNLFLPESFEWLLLRKYDKIPYVSLSINAEKEYTASCKNLPFKYKKGKLNNNLKDRKYIADFEISDDLLKSYLATYNCDISVAELRNMIYNIKGDLGTDAVIKTALVLHTLNKL